MAVKVVEHLIAMFRRVTLTGVIGRVGLAADEQYPCALGLCGAWHSFLTRIANQAVNAVALYGVLCAVLLFGL